MDIYNYSNTLNFSFYYSLKKYPEINAVFKEIWKTIPTEGKQRKTVAEMKKYLKYYICNMINAMYQGKYVVIPLNAKEIAAWEVLNLPHKVEYAKRVPWVALTNALVDEGWINKIAGFRPMTRQNFVEIIDSEIVVYNDQIVFYRQGCRTRVVGTDKLHKLLKTAKVYPEENPSPLIVLREKKEKNTDKPKEIAFTDNSYTVHTKRFLETLNKIYDNNDFQYIADVEMRHYVNPYAYDQDAVFDIDSRKDLTSHEINGVEFFSYPRDEKRQQRLFPRVCAIYNNGTFSSGGRLYSKPLRGESYMNIYREDRHRIKINGKRTVEPDYNSLHISILYAIKKIQLNIDPYDLESGNEGLRTMIKKLLLTMINSASVAATIKAMRQMIHDLRLQNVICERDLKFLIACNQSEQQWNDANVPDWEELINRLQDLHHPIKDYFCSGGGIKLQRIDSTIMKEVIWHFMEQGIPCLPVHDSVVIAVQHKQELIEVMQQVYKNIMGYECGVS